MDAIVQQWLGLLVELGKSDGGLRLLVTMLPAFLLLEVPLNLLVLVGVLRWFLRKPFELLPDNSYRPRVSCIITCYSEGLDVPVAVITAFGNADQAVQALKNGAFDYLQKPITLAQLRSLVKSAIKINEGEEPATAASPPVSESPPAEEPAPTAPPAKPQAAAAKPTNVPAAVASANAEIPRLLGTSALMEDVRQMVRKLAKTMVPVYIAGESGSGKEQAARSIHELSARREQPFVAVNCGAIPENLMESEFFGYKKGSFTGADTDRLGFFQHADGGTLFLDEVADLPLAMQVKLLRAIQEKAVRRIGEATEKTVDVRIICATHKDLAAQVAAGHFRQD